ncbi:MAG: hypothetical protein JW994_07200 [Candidatus Omnitrophica bacterium]|nr:hypothetical protein [Candidatus Omnitrophota bacterium]
MGNKSTGIITAVLGGIGILLLLASAFDLVPSMDNALVFLGIACLIIAGIIKKIGKGGCCN